MNRRAEGGRNTAETNQKRKPADWRKNILKSSAIRGRTSRSRES